MPGISEPYEQSLLTANIVWRKLTRPVFRPGRAPSWRGPLCVKFPLLQAPESYNLSGIIDPMKRAPSMNHAGE